MRFEWDDPKAAANRRKHGVSFEDAITAFDDPWALRAPDPKHSTTSEERTWLIGERTLECSSSYSRPGSQETVIDSSARGGRAVGSVRDMPRAREFPFETARRVTAREVAAAQKAIEDKLGRKRPRRGRPPKGATKYRPVSIRLHPQILAEDGDIPFDALAVSVRREVKSLMRQAQRNESEQEPCVPFAGRQLGIPVLRAAP